MPYHKCHFSVCQKNGIHKQINKGIKGTLFCDLGSRILGQLNGNFSELVTSVSLWAAVTAAGLVLPALLLPLPPPFPLKLSFKGEVREQLQTLLPRRSP